MLNIPLVYIQVLYECAVDTQYLHVCQYTLGCTVDAGINVCPPVSVHAGECAASRQYVAQLQDMLVHCTSKSGVAAFIAEPIQVNIPTYMYMYCMSVHMHVVQCVCTLYITLVHRVFWRRVQSICK